MADAPLISVIVPARNAEETIAQSLDSLLAQEVTAWEAFLIDDGSTDGTAAIIAEYVGRDPRFRALQGPCKGAAAARNRGIAEASGRLLMFLDSDDWVDPAYMAKMTAALAAEPAASVVYCGYYRVMPDGRMTDPRVDPRVVARPFEVFAQTCAVVTIHCLLIERELVVRMGGFDPSLATCEDWDLWQRLSREGARWTMVEEPLVFYRASAGSLTRASEAMLRDGREVIFRGFAADSRVANPLPGYAAGAPRQGIETPEIAYAWFALWNLVVDRVSGGKVAVESEWLRPLPAGPEMARGVALTIVEAICVGCRLVPAQLAERWGQFGTAVSEVIDQVAQAWANPAAARRLAYALDRLVLDYDDLAAPRTLGRTVGVRVNLAAPVATELPEGIDAVYAYASVGASKTLLLYFGALGTVTARDWVALALREGAGLAPLVRHTARRRPLRLGVNMAAGLARAGWRNRRSLLSATGLRQTARRAASEALATSAGPPSPAGSHSRVLGEIAAAAEREAEERRVAPAGEVARQSAEESREGPRKQFWENYFSVEDPWNYGSPYEQEKYRHQIAILPDAPISQALELACAEGHFSRLLAPKVERLLATDISATAVDRARERCRDAANAEFAVLDLAADPLPPGMALITCSEVLYYLNDLDELRAVAGRIADALAPGGHLVSAHAKILVDDRSVTGFDWGNPFGAKVISEAFAATPGLALDRTIETELYRIDRFRRVEPGGAAGPAQVERAAIAAPIEMAVARQIIWDGAQALRGEVAGERRSSIPVLMYHAVSDEGPADLARYRTSPAMFREQMRWLRRHGYHAIGSEELGWFLENNHPFVGRPVLITFDDGLADFAANAWPIVCESDFFAEMFIVTDKVGEAATWDAHYGEAAQLMPAPELVRLAMEGLRLGSHLASHRAADALSSRDLAGELLRSREAVAVWRGDRPHSFAAPFGFTDDRLRRMARECDYRVGFGGRTGPVALGDDLLDLSRIEVRGDWNLDDFIAAMEQARA